ncbi:hypothetical protein NDU88_002289 [Pleurodeles waltl]|uniref:Uncharacterized protein n=1 Tax=Pleurodeles waltl TaxID=8319 RepID=A0AAV7MM76_PLEWA|nr:hypothetical protein NDU88_002289 [Pleurodeles waltl]
MVEVISVRLRKGEKDLGDTLLLSIATVKSERVFRCYYGKTGARRTLTVKIISVRLRKGEQVLGDTLLLLIGTIINERVFRYCYGETGAQRTLTVKRRS